MNRILTNFCAAIVAVAVFPAVLMIIGLIFLSGIITGEHHD